jgi:hypothetical protein
MFIPSRKHDLFVGIVPGVILGVSVLLLGLVLGAQVALQANHRQYLVA